MNLRNEYQPSPTQFLYVGQNDPVFLQNHYIDETYTDEYIQIVGDFRTGVQEAGLPIPTVYGNDISMQDGGRFDCYDPWWGVGGNMSHYFHRWGCDADMNYIGWEFNSQLWQIMRNVITEISLNRPEEEPYCFHVYFNCRAGCNAQ